MTNRLFDRSTSDLNSRNSVRPFNFALKQQLAFDAELESQLLELEQRFVSKPCVPLLPEQRMNTASTATDDACEPCTYDDFGLVEGLELDVSWM